MNLGIAPQVLRSLNKRNLKSTEKCIEMNFQDSFPPSMSSEKRPHKNTDSGMLACIERESQSNVKTLTQANSDFIKADQSSKLFKERSKQAVSSAQNTQKDFIMIMLGKKKVIIQTERVKSSIPYQKVQHQDGIDLFIPEGPCEIEISSPNQMDVNNLHTLGNNQMYISPNVRNMKGNVMQPMMAMTYCNSDPFNRGNTQSLGSVMGQNTFQGVNNTKKDCRYSMLNQN
ncbi:unnamed protein product [Moneuplotes crassus]|uniref:Uncharacterized protein n=1 Tax=Euplotes crassus TaxID=5936 RepID=A0AAD1UJT2_EUPCR|nr:unnamed protein product [Moneuplotes crassus]